ncbi:hypothetical protein T10_2631 [Trichinella papuae]|uniref:Uncharacterized protein n=1 Tax=Trichinella papuae TaxID=268474 RepID=A0A0V1MTX2_9BILA|nr:hypothetical protein T10_2631 [Trichinella papuae]
MNELGMKAHILEDHLLLRFFQNFMIKAAFSVVRMAPLRTLQELRMNTERAVEIGRAFEFQYKAQVPEQNTNILYVENWVPVFNRQFTDLNAHYVPSVLLEVLKQNGQEKCNLSDKVAVLLRKEPMHEVCFCTLHFYCVEKWSTVSTESYGKWLCPEVHGWSGSQLPEVASDFMLMGMLSKTPKSGCAIASHLPAVPDGLAFKNILMGPMAIHFVSPLNSGENDSKFRNAQNWILEKS